MGQKNVVQVYNLLTEGTIEEMIARLTDNAAHDSFRHRAILAIEKVCQT